jgi:hypothetical protein
VSAAWAALAISLLASCATARTTAPADSFAVGFSYPSLAVGPQPLGGIVVREGLEARTASDAILEAVQALQLSVVVPKLDAAGLIPAGARWETDVTPLAAEDVAEHNRRFPAMPLPLDRVYGLQYAGEYRIVGKELRFRLESILHERGTASRFRPYERGPYAGGFFFDRFKRLVQERLPAIAGKGTP